MQNGILKEIAARVETHEGRIPALSRCHCEQGAFESHYLMESRTLGSGQSGAIKLARSRFDHKRKVAVKSFRLDDIRRMDLFEKEVETYLGVDHPNIARLLDVYQSGNIVHLVMECLDGGDLFSALASAKRYSEEEVVIALRQIFLALNYLHTRGYVHRDVKLENLGYASDGALKLIDFGYCTMWDNTSGHMQLGCGTLGYVAPELLAKSYTNKCDMWSAGVVAFMLLSGRAPFHGPRQRENIKSGEYSMSTSHWVNVSQEAKSFVRCLLEVDPSKRLSACEALKHPWMRKNHLAKLPPCMTQVSRRLCQFGRLPKLGQHCMRIVAWSLPNHAITEASRYFSAFDVNEEGVIKLNNLHQALANILPDAEAAELSQAVCALDYNLDQTIHYSDFLAAMVGFDMELDSELLAHAFRKFERLSCEEVGRQCLDGFPDKVDLDGFVNFCKEASSNIQSNSSEVIKMTDPDMQISARTGNDSPNVLIEKAPKVQHNSPVVNTLDDPDMQLVASSATSFPNWEDLPIRKVFNACLPTWIPKSKCLVGCAPFMFL